MEPPTYHDSPAVGSGSRPPRSWSNPPPVIPDRPPAPKRPPPDLFERLCGLGPLRCFLATCRSRRKRPVFYFDKLPHDLIFSMLLAYVRRDATGRLVDGSEVRAIRAAVKRAKHGR